MEIYTTVFKNASATCLARLIGQDTNPIVQSDLASGSYSIFLLDDHEPDSRTSVTGHEAVELALGDVVFDTLQTDDRWTCDTTGYNFCHTIDVSTHPAFALAGRNYLVEYRLPPVDGQVMVARFRFHCI